MLVFINMGNRPMKQRKTKNRPFRALQIEVTSRCTRSCSICPRDSLSDTWRDGDLSQDLWDMIAPDLSLAQHVHLQGWGEPLLHDQLERFAPDGAAAGCTHRASVATFPERC